VGGVKAAQDAPPPQVVLIRAGQVAAPDVARVD